MLSGGRGRGGGGGFGGRGGGGRSFDQGPPARVIPFGYFDFTCQDDLVLKAEIEDVPYFNAPIFLENKSQIGKIDEIFGTLRDYSVSVKLSDNMNASSFVPKQKLFIDPAKLLPLQRFLPQPPKVKIGKKKGDKSGGGDSSRGGFGRGGGRGGGFCKLTMNFKPKSVIDIFLLQLEVDQEVVADSVEEVVALQGEVASVSSS